METIINTEISVSSKEKNIDYHLLSRGIVQAFIKQRLKFTHEEIKNEIIRRNGIMRVSFCFTVSDYLDEFIGRGILRFELNDKDGCYRVISK